MIYTNDEDPQQSQEGEGCYPDCYYYTDSCFRADCKKVKGVKAVKIHDRPSFSKEYISKASRRYNAQYIGTYPCSSKEGAEVESCAVFYVVNPDESFEGDSEVTSKEETQDQQCPDTEYVVLTKAEAQALQRVLQNALFTHNRGLTFLSKMMVTQESRDKLKKYAMYYSRTIKRLEPLQYKLKYNRSRPEQPNRKTP